ncbi:MAG: hypothetical protein V8Q57_00760 [Blautia sp.]
MILPVIYFIIGLILLIKGGDWFVDGATGIAHRFHVPELLIGATVVSIGTTLPEVMVSATSAISGHGEIAYGNAIGSIICNVSLIAAITIAIRPSKVHPNSLKLPGFFFFLAAIFYAGTAYVTGHFSRTTPGSPSDHVWQLHWNFRIPDQKNASSHKLPPQLKEKTGKIPLLSKKFSSWL